MTPAEVGIEAGSRVYAGRAGAVSPAGAWVARAPSDRAGIVLHTIDGTDLDASGPPVDAPPSTPGPLASRSGEGRRAAVVAIGRTPSAVDLIEGLRALVRSAAAQGASLIVLPDLAGADTRAVTSAESLPLLEALSAETGTTLVVALAERGDGATHKTAYVIERGRHLAAHRQSCLNAAERAAGFVPGIEPPPVVTTSLGRLGVLCGVEALVPPLTYGLVERGATQIAWCAGDRGRADGAGERHHGAERRKQHHQRARHHARHDRGRAGDGRACRGDRLGGRARTRVQSQIRRRAVQCGHSISWIRTGGSTRRSVTVPAFRCASQNRSWQRWHWCSRRFSHASSAQIELALRGRCSPSHVWWASRSRYFARHEEREQTSW